jgi:hypothetical protein
MNRVPLVIYVDGEKVIVGDALLEEDETVVAVVTDHDLAEKVLFNPAREFSVTPDEVRAYPDINTGIEINAFSIKIPDETSKRRPVFTKINGVRHEVGSAIAKGNDLEIHISSAAFAKTIETNDVSGFLIEGEQVPQ